ncbi:hypothetical protein BK140_12405 [Paenibacillus macerans]|nr:hypothetical protein BK140_12405 [Paenibacillus macerans]
MCIAFLSLFLNPHDLNPHDLNPPKPSLTVREGSKGLLPFGYPQTGLTWEVLRRSLALSLRDSLELRAWNAFLPFGVRLTLGAPGLPALELTWEALWRSLALSLRDSLDFVLAYFWRSYPLSLRESLDFVQFCKGTGDWFSRHLF